MVQEITGHYVMINNTRIFYDECGEGIPLFCIHTAGATSLEFRYLLPIMADNGFRAIALDLPGHGRSYPLNWDPFRKMHEYAEFTWKVAKAVCRGEKPIITGMSIGGDMTLDLACYHSKDMRAAIPMEGAAHTPTFADCSELEHPHACPGWHNILETGSCHSLHNTCSRERVVELQWQHRSTHQQTGACDLECWLDHDVRDKLKNIKCPVLLLRGEGDFFVPEELIDQTLKGIPAGLGEKHIVKNAGHYPALEVPEEVAKIMMNFLKRKKVM